ncbi:MAG TPA: prenyltransferase, partial [Polyangia bacterium]|nr:prenyltransferase [Polyangia bacterium]
MRRLVAFVKLGRPQFLVGGFVLYGLGAALAVAGGAPFDGWRFGWGQLVVTATQLMTHYANDYFDLAADRANRTPTRWSGGSRVLPDGALAPAVALRAARLLLAVAAIAAAVLARRAGGGALALAAAMIGLAWGYSAPPLRFCARGLGELTTALVVTVLVPVFGYRLQAGAVAAPIFFAAALPAALQFAMLLAIELPDAAGDVAAGKRTLVVRLGALAAARLYAALTLAAFGALPLWARAGLPARVAMAPLLLAPIAIWQAARVARGAYGDPARWGSVAFWAVALLIGS